MERTYQSRFGATRPITFAQMVAETTCGRQAKLNGKTLPVRFWNLPEWKRLFPLQVMLCNSLLVRFDSDVIATVLRTTGRFIATLRNPQLVPLLEEEVRKRESARVIASARASEASPAVATSCPGSGVAVTARPSLSRPGSLFNNLD